LLVASNGAIGAGRVQTNASAGGGHLRLQAFCFCRKSRRPRLVVVGPVGGVNNRAAW